MSQDSPTSGSRLSRRDFIVAGGAGVASLLPATSHAQTVASSSIRIWDYETDVAVVGSAGAASTAALAANTRGAKVIILGRAPAIGGTTAKSGGAFWSPEHCRLKPRRRA